MLVFDSNLKPVVGQQVTLRSSNHGVAVQRLALLAARADRGDCDLTARGIGRPVRAGGKFPDGPRGDDASDRARSSCGVFPGVALTSAGAAGSGVRLAIDGTGRCFLDGGRGFTLEGQPSWATPTFRRRRCGSGKPGNLYRAQIFLGARLALAEDEEEVRP